MALSFDHEVVTRTADHRDGGIHVGMTYVGFARLLPDELHALCSCAGLFYAQVLGVCADGDLYRVEIAALSHYFIVDPQTRKRHVREIFLPGEQVGGQLLEYDRRLAGLATCDLRELVGEHAAQTAAVAAVPAVGDCEDEEEPDEEEADLVPLPSIFVSRATICESLETLQVTGKRERCVQTVMLHAILETLSTQLKYCSSTRERRHLQRSYDQVCAVQQWRRQRRDEGYRWQRVVTLEPAWEQDRAGWDLIVGVPAQLAVQVG